MRTKSLPRLCPTQPFLITFNTELPTKPNTGIYHTVNGTLSTEKKKGNAILVTGGGSP
jgi:hypothetical protein